MGRLDGRVAFLTGAGRGIGAATAAKLAAEGAAVAVTDMDAGPAEETANEIRSSGGKAISMPVDVINREQVEADKRRRRFIGEPGNPRRRGMEPKLERIEIEPFTRRDDNFAIHHAIGRQLLQKRLVQLRKIPIQRPQVPALDEHVRVAAKNDGAKPIPFRFVKKIAAGGKCLGKPGEHRLDRRRDREASGLRRSVILPVFPACGFANHHESNLPDTDVVG